MSLGNIIVLLAVPVRHTASPLEFATDLPHLKVEFFDLLIKYERTILYVCTLTDPYLALPAYYTQYFAVESSSTCDKLPSKGSTRIAPATRPLPA